MRYPCLLLSLLALGLPQLAHGVANAPVPTAEERMRADAVARMNDASPADRLVKLLETLELNRAELFALAGPDPILVVQVVDEESRAVLGYLGSLPATELSDLRAGNTVVRRMEGFSKREYELLVEMATAAGIKKPKKLQHVRVGTITGRNMRFELVTKKGSIELEFAGGPTPVEEEKARKKLTAHFGARPAEITSGPGTRLPLEDSSFEQEDTLGSHWALEPCVNRGSEIPAADVTLDRDETLDGLRSLRFHSDAQTRNWPQVAQRVSVAPGTPLVLRGHAKAHYLRKERDQERQFRMALVFLDIEGNVVGQPADAALITGDMDWREFVVKAVAPPQADYVKVLLSCTVSGTAWFDGLSLEIGY